MAVSLQVETENSVGDDENCGASVGGGVTGCCAGGGGGVEGNVEVDKRESSLVREVM